MLLPPPDISAAYIEEKRSTPSKDFYNWVRSLYDTVRDLDARVGSLEDTVEQLTTPIAVGALPAPVAGARAFVNDANATTFASIVASGGANLVPVYSDGANWRIG
jgi:hypothetical protein